MIEDKPPSEMAYESPAEGVFRVLIVEDDPNDCILIERSLRRAGLHVSARCVEDEHELLAALQHSDWEIVLADYDLRGFSGLDVLRLVQESGKDVPVVLVSGAIDVPQALHAMRVGARDFVFKDEMERLPPIIKREVADAGLRRREHATRAERDDALNTMRLLLEAANAVGRATGSHQVAEELARILSRSTLHSRSFVGLLDEGRRELEIIASAGKTPLTPGKRWPVGSVSQAQWKSIAEGRAQVWDIEDLPDEAREDYASFQVLHVLYAPLVHQDRIIGVLVLDEPGERREFSNNEIALVEGIASQAAVAIENARLYERERESARLSRALTEIDSLIHSTLDIDSVAPRALEHAAEVLGVSSAGVAIREGAKWWPRYVYNVPQAVTTQRFTDQRFPVSVAVEQRRDVITDYWRYPKMADEAAKNGHLNGLHAPLVVGGRFLGEVGFHIREARPFSEPQVDFVRRLAASFALAIENASLYDAQYRIADRLQEALLSVPDEISGIDFAHAYHSATETARVGGDFYDVFEIEHDMVGIVIGDVAGKGLDAAVLTALLKNAIRAHTSEKGATPARILSLTNDVVYRSTPAEAFATVFFGVLDCRDGQLIYCNAGHTTAALVGRGVVKLPSTGPLIGAFLDVVYDQSSVCIDLDQLLFLYTDGLTEARRDHELLGEERVFDWLDKLSDGQPGSAVRSLVQQVLDFTGGRLVDDLALLALRRLPGGRMTGQQKMEL